jgi:hypothetical protein
MNAAASVSAILLGIAGAFVAGAGWQATQNRSSSPNSALVDQVNLMQLRRMCSEQAIKDFKESEQHKPDVIETWMAHYNPSLKKCFTLSSISTINGQAHTTQDFFYLEDAFDRVEYGNFDAVKNWGEGTQSVHVVACEMVPNGIEQTPCKSQKEWNTFAEKYMETTLQDQ